MEVKPDSPYVIDHILADMGRVVSRVRDGFPAEDWNGLRQSHLRVLAALPDDGISITELAGRLGMTKQGCGQLVATLADIGAVRVRPAPHDKRARVVRRTASGTRLVSRTDERIRELEAGWASEVGPERYAVFREVLREIAGRRG